MPSAMPSTVSSSVSRGSPMATNRPRGRAPMAAMSLKLTAAAIHPIWNGVVGLGKCVLRVTRSVLATRYREPRRTAAASSPSPISPEGPILPMRASTTDFSPMSHNLTIVPSLSRPSF